MTDTNLSENPFTPSFGEIPLYMAGRTQVIHALERSLDRAQRSPELTMLVYGARGTGKTALLAKLSEEARSRGWISVNVTAEDGMLEDILIQASRNASHIVSNREPDKRITGLSIGQIAGIEWEHASHPQSNWRSDMEDLINDPKQSGAGLFITVDEVSASIPEMIKLASTYQHFVRERRRVALIMAGLPYNIDMMKENQTISFIRRAQHEQLGRIANDEVKDAIFKTVKAGGRSISGDALEHMTNSSQGFPFLIQLVGYRTWDESPDSTTISLDDAVHGANLAYGELRTRILDSTYRALSDGDVMFLKAMLVSPDASTMREIADRMGKTNAYASTYKTRLLKQGIIGQSGRNAYDFELPGFREYLTEVL